MPMGDLLKNESPFFISDTNLRILYESTNSIYNRRHLYYFILDDPNDEYYKQYLELFKIVKRK